MLDLSGQGSERIEIREAIAADVPRDLLLLADPSDEKIRSYLPRSRCFVASKNGEIVGVCAIQPSGAGTYELMNIAVHPSHQNFGHGTTLLKWVINFFHDAGAKKLEVGTGTFGYQLAFYQRQGFRVTSIDRDFFIKNYGEPIFEDGIQLFDMLRLTLDLP
ncbi:MAG: GNAT family N-acetyltransferase [Azoarcus sp.]|nr:GNAT family N-acetyltransferase [Azoarcus sp.]